MKCAQKQSNMKGTRPNFCQPVREALIQAGYSYVRVLSAVNSFLGQLEAVQSTAKVGHGRLTKSSYKVSETEKNDYETGKSIVGIFDSWSCAIERADKIAEMDSVSLPAKFNVWLQKMKEPTPLEQGIKQSDEDTAAREKTAERRAELAKS